MATNFSANQYESAFVSRKMQNWEVPSQFQERPRSIKGSPKVIATDRGHLLPEYRRSNKGTSNKFVGTWDMPRKLPGNRINVPTARSQEAFERLRNQQNDSDIQSIRCQPKISSFRATTNELRAAEAAEILTHKSKESCSCNKNPGSSLAATGQQNAASDGLVADVGRNLAEGMESNRIVAL